MAVGTRSADSSEADRLLDPKAWPAPSWFKEKPQHPKLKRYEDYLAHQLRSRYIELEGDWRTVYGNYYDEGQFDEVTAERAADLLHLSRRALEEDKPDLLAVSSALDLVERYMVWLYPPHIAEARLAGLRLRANTFPLHEREPFTKLIDTLFDERGVPYQNLRDVLGHLRAVFDEVIGAYNRYTLLNQISSGLQIQRLKALRKWGTILLCVFFAASPLVTSPTGSFSVNWPYRLTLVPAALSTAWLASFAIMLIGGLGGFLSGLLQVRNARVTLAEYQESMLKLHLKVLVGAMVSLILFTLLTWNILPGIRIESPGSFFFIAFISGFSERYFLKLLKLEYKESDEEAANASQQPPKIPISSPGEEDGSGKALGTHKPQPNNLFNPTPRQRSSQDSDVD